jgi:flagellin
VGANAEPDHLRVGQQYTAQVTSGALDGSTNVNLGALTINGTAVGSATVAADAKLLTDAINAANISGVRAAVTGPTTVAGSTMTAAALTGTITINGVTTASISTTTNAASSRTSVVSAINAISAATGVTATDDGSVVNLSAADGRNITTSFTTLTAAATGLGAAGTAESTYTVTYSGVAGRSAASGPRSARCRSRFEAVVGSLQTNAENLSASRSRILDADFASETASLTRAQILQQAGVAMLAQANALPQNVLALLRG